MGNNSNIVNLFDTVMRFGEIAYKHVRILFKIISNMMTFTGNGTKLLKFCVNWRKAYISLED